MAMSQISVNDLSFCYDGSRDMIFKHVSFQVDTDWKLGFYGTKRLREDYFSEAAYGKIFIRRYDFERRKV